MSRTVQYDLEGNEVYNSAWPDELNYEEEGDDEMEKTKMAKLESEKLEKAVDNIRSAFNNFNKELTCKGIQEDQNDIVKEPEHYKHGQFEVIDEMIIMFGWEATVMFCKINAWKYRARAPYKGKMEEDLRKADRYLEYARDIELANNGGTDILLKE